MENTIFRSTNIDLLILIFNCNQRTELQSNVFATRWQHYACEQIKWLEQSGGVRGETVGPQPEKKNLSSCWTASKNDTDFYSSPIQNICHTAAENDIWVKKEGPSWWLKFWNVDLKFICQYINTGSEKTKTLRFANVFCGIATQITHMKCVFRSFQNQHLATAPIPSDTWLSQLSKIQMSSQHSAVPSEHVWSKAPSRSTKHGAGRWHHPVFRKRR